MRVWLFTCIALGAFACGSDDSPITPDAGLPQDAGPDAPERREPWEPFPAPDVDAPIFDDDPWLEDEANGWRTAFDPAAGTPTRAQRGGFGLGNGHVFALLGIGEPDLATIHEAIGPGYDKDLFFSDLTAELRIDGQPFSPTAQWQWRPRGTAVVVTLTRGPDLDVIFVDAAPWTRSTWWDAANPEERALVRLVAAHATGTAPVSNVEVSMKTRSTFSADDSGAIRQIRDDGGQRARLIAPNSALTASPGSRSLTVSLGDIDPGAEARATFALVMSANDGDETATIGALESAAPLDLIRQTRDSWRAWMASGATLDTPEPMVGDLIDAVLVLMKVQQAANGAVCPMSEYTHVWLRDMMGPIQGFVGTGHLEDARRALDYLWVAIVERGDLGNALPADFPVPSPLPDSPDFSALPTLTGEVRAEGPSHVVLVHDEVARFSADRSDIDARFPLLWRALTAQAIDDSDLLPFSGDETYRTAMAIALGYEVDEQFTEGFKSLDSSALLTIAAERLAEQAEALGRSSEATALGDLAARSRAAVEATFWLEGEGFYAPLLRPDGGVDARPFEDASEKPAWLGFVSGARGRRSLSTVWQRLDTEQGFPVSPPDPGALASLIDLYPPAASGVYTGMAPGYFLGAAARVDLPEGEAGVDAIGRTASTTGSWEEYTAYSDNSSVAAIYDPNGALGEYTARFRPWESGINMRALLDWLVGLDVELSVDGIAVRVAPRLARGWPDLALRGVRVADATLDIEVSETVDGSTARRRVQRTRTGGAASISLTVGFRLTGTEVLAVSAGGQDLDLGSLQIESSSAESRLRFDVSAGALSDGEPLVVEVTYTPAQMTSLGR